ncbi:MAG: replication-associated recombination protein A, partial [Candidatus Marinimicrobia bacterium]|nr:replication-associated recombination protein A [Candidatus Neomarinimicrobiota bacterium]
ALLAARHTVSQSGTPSVPLHLRNAPTQLMKDQGYGKNYIYPHDHEGHFVQETYLPKAVKTVFYKPTNQGYDKFIRQRLQELWPERYEK